MLFCDADSETDRDDTKSQTGYVFVLNGGAVDWKSSKQIFVWNFMSRRRIIECEIEMITEEVEDDSAIIYDKDARSKVRSFAKKEEAKRWSLQEEIAKTFEQPLKHGLFIWNDVPCSISPCYKPCGDYICTSIVDVWPDIRKKNRLFRGPTHAGCQVPAGY
ncbi:hypothetical protein Tco_0394283 [Tanacetum coccineum]